LDKHAGQGIRDYSGRKTWAFLGTSTRRVGTRNGDEGTCAVHSRALTAMMLVIPMMCSLNGAHG
jgi:hypothetical protein